MSRAQRVFLWGAAWAALITGLGYAYMRYVMVGRDPFSAYNHPAQPWALVAHVFAAPVLLLAVGWFWGNHVEPKLRRKVRSARHSGLWLLALVGVMTLSGYLVQTVTQDALRTAAGWVHGISGSVFFILLVGHLLLGRRSVAARRPVPEGSAD